MLDLFICIILGIVFGVFTGLIPGIHINTVASILLINYTLLDFSTFNLSIFILSLTITHTILDFIPSIFLGVPSDDILSILPGHKLLKEGRGIEAVSISTLGSIIGCVILLIFLPLIYKIIPPLYTLIRPIIHWILITIIIFLTLKEGKNFPKALLIVLISSIFGIISLQRGEQVLYHAFTGMFGISTLLSSLKENNSFPTQKESKINISKKDIYVSSFLSLISSSLLSVIPGLGSSQAAILSQIYSKKTETFLFSLGSIGTLVGLMSIISISLIGKARSGGGIAIEKIFGALSIKDVIIFCTIALIVSIIAGIISIYLSKVMSNIFPKLNYRKISISIIIFLITVGIYFDGLVGLINMTIATIIGHLTIQFGVNRSHCMGFLMGPIILFFIGFI